MYDIVLKEENKPELNFSRCKLNLNKWKITAKISKIQKKT